MMTRRIHLLGTIKGRHTAGLARALASFPFVAVVLAGLSLAVYFSPAAAAALQYDVAAPRLTQVWRPITCHWAHWSPGHLAWSGGAFAVLGAACERRGRRRFLACVSGSALLISLALWLFRPEMPTYRGLSGIDSALFVMLAVLLLRERRREEDGAGAHRAAVTGVVLLAFVAKIVFELAAGAAVFVDSAADHFVPVPLAHLAGAAAGATAGCFPGRTARRATALVPPRGPPQHHL